MSEQVVDPQRMLRDLVRGRSDEEIIATVSEFGVRSVLDQIFAEMRSRVRAPKHRETTIQWVITSGAERRLRYLCIRRGRVTWSRGQSPSPPDVELQVTLPDFIRITTGLTSPPWAVLRGRLQVADGMRGLLRARRFHSLFKHDGRTVR